MNIEQWISCMAEAYKEAGKTLSHRKKEILLGSLSEDNSDIDERTKYATAFGSIVEPLAAQDESFKEVIEETTELFTHYFFKKVTLGEVFGPITRVEQKFGHSLEANYAISGGPFMDMTRTYWTYKLEIEDLLPKYYNLVMSQVLLQIEGSIGSVFFPFPGPAITWVRERRETQRELLEEYAAGMDIDAFLNNNPFLGTAKGRIAKAVFDEKVWVRCPNPDCLRFLKIPNAVKQLEIKCPKCKKRFLFPAEDLSWLNHLAPHFHPAAQKIKELETLRHLWDIPHDVFAVGIVGSVWATEQLQRKLYEEAKHTNPLASDKEIFREMVASRTENRIPFGLDMDEEAVDKAIESMKSLDDLVVFILKEESEEPSWPDPFGIGSKIEGILRS
jgi:phage FluMu protein Com